EQAKEMEGLGIEPGKIFVCGMILRSKIMVDPLAIKKSFGIKPGEKVILVGTGSLGIGFNIDDLGQLAKLKNAKIIFVCGKNQKLLDQVQALALANVTALGFYQPMDELYAIADVFISKPGGLSTAEALAWRLPLVVAYTLPGQEQKNLEYLAKKN